MKIIELLNKIANKEALPIKIKYENNIYEYKGLDYFCEETHKWFFTEGLDELMLDLNDEMEIIEEEEFEDIENFDPMTFYKIDEELCRKVLTKHDYIISKLIANQNKIIKKPKETERS